MTIRVRLVVMCLVIALLPAIPVSMLVKALLEKSFDVGLNTSPAAGIRSGDGQNFHLFACHHG